MESIERNKTEKYDSCNSVKGSMITDAFELLNPNDYPEDQRPIVEEFNRRAEIGNQRHRTALRIAEATQQKSEKQLKEITELNTEEQNRLSVIQSAMKVYFAAIYIDLKNDSYITLKRVHNMEQRGFKKQGQAQETLFSLSSSNVCLPEFAEMMHQFMDLSTLNERMKDTDTITMQYLGVLNGWQQVFFIAGDREEDGTLKTVMLTSRQIHEEKEKELAQLQAIEDEREKVAEAYGMIEGFSKEYHTIWVVSKETSRMHLIRSNGRSTIKRAVQMGIDEPLFDPAVVTYVNSCIEPEDRERMLREISFAEVMRHLSEHPDDIYAVNYLRRDDSGHVGFHQIAFANADTDNGTKQFVYGFRDIDKIVKEEQKKKEELQEALHLAQEATARQAAQMEKINALNTELTEQKENLEKHFDAIKSLSKVYYGSFYVDVDNDDYYELLTNDEIKDKYAEFGPKGKSQTTLNWVCENRIAPEYREAARAFMDYSTLSERMRNKEVISIRVQLVTGDWSRIRFIAGSRHEDGTLKSCTYVVRNINKEVAEEQERNAELHEALTIAQDSAAEREAQLEEITALNLQLQENQTQLEESAAEQEAQLEEIAALNTQMENNQAELEAAVSEQESQIKKITELNHSLAEYNNAMASAGYGMWHIILKDGVVPRMQVNDKMAELLGVAGQNLTEEELYKAWYDRIVPDAIPSVQASVGEMLNGKFSENTYQWTHPTKGTIYVRCGGTAQKLEDGTNILSGYHADVTDIVEKDEQKKTELQSAYDQLEKSTSELEEQYRISISLARDYSNVFVIDTLEATFRTITLRKDTRELIGIEKYETYPYQWAVNRYTSASRLYPEDADAMIENMRLEHVIEELKDKDEFSGNYRIVENGAIHYYRFTYRRVADTQYVLLGFQSMDKLMEDEIRRNKELEEAKNAILLENEIISTISKMYFAIFRIDLTENYYEEVSSDNSVHIITGHDGNAQEKMNELCATFVTEKYRSNVSDFFDLSTIEERLKDLDTIEYQYHATDGNWHEARFIVKKRNESGTVTHILYVTRIISAIKQKELEAQEALLKAKDAAEAANRAKTSFLFNMSHDIRTPMNAIIGYANLMKRNPHRMDKWPNYLDKVLASSEFLLGLINNVLEMARIESGKTVLDEGIYSIDAFIDQVYSVFSDEMGKKELKFTKSVDLEHQYFYGDSIKLREIVLNIISNAQKYTRPGGSVDMTIKELPSEVEGLALVQTTVTDTGIGMSEEFLPHIFEEFTREQNSSGNKIQGTGLGMPIVKKLVELMKGTIEVRSTVGEGSTFIVTIPHRIAEKPEEKAKKDKIDYSDFKGKRILLAEDNDLNAEIAMEILSEYGFKVERAEDGVVCVDMLSKAEEGYYDVILMDIQMPNLDGYGATRTIRDLDDLAKADIPIIAMTANAFDEDKRNAIDAGMDAHVAKPIEIPALMKALADVFNDRSSFNINAHRHKEDPVSHVMRIYYEMQRSMSVLPGGFFAYKAEQPEKLIFANDLCCSIWGCKNFEEFKELVGGSFKGIVHPDDYERVEKEIWHQIDSKDTGLDQVKYKIIKKDGTVSHVDDYGRLIRDEEIGDIFYVFIAET